jgi:hypothetical protein
MFRLFADGVRHYHINADMMKPMRRLFYLLLCSGALGCAGDLSSAKTVYVLSMSHGMDQYLANRLANGHSLQVVTDPKRADVFFTDNVGPAFQSRMEAIFPPPPPPEPVKDDTKDAKKEEATTGNSMFGPTVNKLENPALASSFGRNKGTIFLVDAKSREILWSVYDPPKSNSAKDLDRTANDIVSRFKKDLTKK